MSSKNRKDIELIEKNQQKPTAFVLIFGAKNEFVKKSNGPIQSISGITATSTRKRGEEKHNLYYCHLPIIKILYNGNVVFSFRKKKRTHYDTERKERMEKKMRYEKRKEESS